MAYLTENATSPVDVVSRASVARRLGRMFEFECHDWSSLQGVWGAPDRVRPTLEKLLESSDASQWKDALDWLDSYATDLGVVSEATAAVVACLIPIVLRCEGEKRSAILDSLDAMTCGRGVEFCSDEELARMRAGAIELSRALPLWLGLAELGEMCDAAPAVAFLAYSATYVPELEPRVRGYLVLAEARPGLRTHVTAIRDAMTQDIATIRARASTCFPA